MQEGKSCPISGKKVNETVIRIIAFQVIILTAFALYSNAFYISLFLTIDFCMRGFNNGKGSLLRIIAKLFAEKLNLSANFVDEKPKQFAAKVGFLACGLLFSFQLLNFELTSYVIGFTLIFFASLESFLAICVGCILYQQFSRFSWFKVYS